MKILKIKALNINSLKGELEIDFRTFLNDNALFAITGPTGSGKSTILDIITCALYGRTPRLKKPPNELMSRHTGECYCEVEFEIKGKVYRSSWAIKRARKSPEGKFQSAKMELSDVETSKVIKSTLSDVPKYVEELSGLDFDRFKQSMVLAQGGFDAFLKADEKERSTLLEKMTGTQIYKQISLEIYDRYSSNKVDIDLDKNILESTQLLDSKELEYKTKALADKTKEKLEYDKKEKELIQIKTWLETLAKLEADNITYTQLFTSISKEKEDKKESFTKLALSNKALNVEVSYTKHNTLETVLEKDKANHTLLLSELDELNKVLKSLDSSHIVLMQDSRKAKEHFDTETNKIKELRTLETQIHEKEKSLDILIKHIEYKQSETNTFRKDLEAISSEYSSIEDKSKVVNAYIQSNSKDEKLIELLPLVKKNIEEYKSQNTSLSDIHESHKLLIKEQSLQNSVVEVLDKESKDLKSIYESINKDYYNTPRSQDNFF